MSSKVEEIDIYRYMKKYSAGEVIDYVPVKKETDILERVPLSIAVILGGVALILSVGMLILVGALLQ